MAGGAGSSVTWPPGEQVSQCEPAVWERRQQEAGCLEFPSCLAPSQWDSMPRAEGMGGTAAASSQQRLGPTWLPSCVGVGAGLQHIPVFYPLFLDVVMEAASTQPEA